MLRLLRFLYRNRIFLLFLFLEGVCFWLIASYSNRYNTYFLNSSGAVVGSVNETVGSVQTYFSLQDRNEELYEENLMLRKLLANKNISNIYEGEFLSEDSLFKVYEAEVLNATYLRARNFLTLKLSSEHTIEPGMGVISSSGVVGIVKSVSAKYATVYSLLDPKLLVSGRVISNQGLCSIQWDGRDMLTSVIQYHPRHLELQEGDSVLTSGFDGVFPEGIFLGTADEVEKSMASPFYNARLALGVDFSKIQSVYIVEMVGEEIIKELENELED